MTISLGQDQTELDNLVKLGELYSNNVNATGKDFKKQANKLRTPGLQHIIDALIAVGKGDEILITEEFLSKPSEQELKYWYVLRNIHYNNLTENGQPEPNIEIAKKTLSQDIDSRWLLDNYYYRINSGIAKLFNKGNLSKYDLDLDSYGLDNETEKAIFFLAISNSLIQRFRVLQMMKNNDKLFEFASRLPTFNGNPYFEYTEFDFEDFDWVGYDKTKSYKSRHLKDLFLALNAHFSALAEKESPEELRHIYYNSILYIPEYFEYAGEMKDDLKKLYKQLKK